MTPDRERADADLVARLRPEIADRLKAIHTATLNDPARFDRVAAIKSNARLGLAHLGLSVPHDPDYAVFRHLRAGHGVVLDIGANSGQSAASVWAAGSDVPVVSFEPLSAQRPALDAIRRARRGRFEYRLVALSDRDGDLDMIVPVVNGQAASWLASAARDIDWTKMGLTVATYIVRKHYRENRAADVDLAFFRVKARRLDSILARGLKHVAVAGIAAIKIDVEGYETEVVAGAAETLAHFGPLLLVERAQDRPSMLLNLQALGYLVGARESDYLVPVDEPGQNRNTFFWHASQQDRYRKLGLLRASS